MSQPTRQGATVAAPDPSVKVVRGGSNDEPVAFDELGRDTQLLGLVRIISRADPPLVIGVHGDWGEGKTSFMRVLQALLGEETRAAYREIEERDKLPQARLPSTA